MILIGFLINQIISIYIFIIIVTAVISWLSAFEILNSNSQALQKIMYICSVLTEPLLRPIRKIVPPIQGLDLSPVILFLLMNTFRFFLNTYIFTY